MQVAGFPHPAYQNPLDQKHARAQPSCVRSKTALATTRTSVFPGPRTSRRASRAGPPSAAARAAPANPCCLALSGAAVARAGKPRVPPGRTTSLVLGVLVIEELRLQLREELVLRPVEVGGVPRGLILVHGRTVRGDHRVIVVDRFAARVLVGRVLPEGVLRRRLVILDSDLRVDGVPATTALPQAGFPEPSWRGRRPQ